MSLLALTLTAALGAAQPAGPAPLTYAGPAGRVAITTWRYASDPVGAGEQFGFPTGTFAGTRVRVPHNANPARPGSPAAPTAFRGGVGWYRTRIRTGSGTYVLRFESVASRARVWIDGRLIAEHRRAYEAFQARAPLADGVHTVVVRADWFSPSAQSAEGLHRTWFNWGGINREVTVRRVGPSEIAGVAATTRLRGHRARVTITARVRNTTATARTVPVIARLVRRGHVQIAALGKVALPAGATATVGRTITVLRPALWSPGHGRLYTLTLGVPFEGAFRARIGLREVAFSGGTLRINGRAVVLRGASVQEDQPGRGDALRAGDLRGIVHRLKAIGATATRAQHPLSPALLERLDRAGIAVWQQVGPVDSPGQWRTSTPVLQARATQQVHADVRDARLHPSIIAWSLGCEVAGDGAPGQAQFIDARAQELHAADPGRGVAVDIWTDHVPAVPGALYAHLDAVGVTSYLGWYEQTFASLPEQQRLLRTRVDELRARFPGKAIVVSELGAEGTPDNPPAARGGTGYQAALLRSQLTTLRTTRGLAGAFVWVLRDFAVNPAFDGGSIVRIDPRVRLVRGLNQKGVYDYAGRPKPAAAVVASILRSFRP